MGDRSRRVTEPVVKSLFAYSGNRCAFPGCGQALVESKKLKKVVGEIAHIVAHGEDGPRADKSFPVDQLNLHENLVLLCPTCHTRVDKYEHQYTSKVLREMKRAHEARFSPDDAKAQKPEILTDEIFVSALPVSRLPMTVFSAETDYRKQNMDDFWDNIDERRRANWNLPFDLRSGRLYAFHNLSKTDGPFAEVCRPGTTERHRATDMWSNPDEQRAYTYLLNRTLKSHLYKKGVRFHPKYSRYYFLPGRNGGKRTERYRSLTGRSQRRNVVWNPITKATGRGKRHWIHIAAGLRLQYVGNEKWLLAIRPERYLTKDGRVEFESKNVGRKVTRMKATMHNRGYLAEVSFWASFVCELSPRLSIQFGNQWFTIENRLLECEIDWIGIPDDDASYSERQPEEDLFSVAEQSRIDDQLDGLDDYGDEE